MQHTHSSSTVWNKSRCTNYFLQVVEVSELCFCKLALRLCYWTILTVPVSVSWASMAPRLCWLVGCILSLFTWRQEGHEFTWNWTLLEYLPCNWHCMKATLMQREMACGAFTMTQFKLCRRQQSSSCFLLFLNTWKWWNTLMPMKDYDLTHKSMAMNMCLTN